MLPSNPNPVKIKVEWEIDSKLLGFIRALQKLHQKESMPEGDYVSGLLSVAVARLLNIDLEKKSPK